MAGEKLRYDTVEKYKVRARLVQPMHVGSAMSGDNDILVHPVENIPFLQASGIAGVFRSYCERNHPELTKQYFGEGNKRKGSLAEGERVSDGVSALRFTDGYFERRDGQGYGIELRPRVAIDPVSGTVSEASVKGSGQRAGHKFEMMLIGAGAELVFAIYAYSIAGVSGKASGMDELLRETFGAMNDYQVQLGGQKSNGCGFISVEEVRYWRFNLRTDAGRKAWAEEDTLPDKSCQECLREFQAPHEKPAYTLTVNGKTEGGILVKAIAVPEVGEMAPDSQNIQNANKEYILPGSSFKGAIRSRVEYICKKMKKMGVRTEDIVWDTFGGWRNPGDTKSEQKVGNARFFDTVVGKKEKNDASPLVHRIRIDKFTGGVVNKGLFSEKNAFGDVCLKISILRQGNAERSCAVLLLALRDLANKLFNLGSGYSVGKGFIEVDNIVVEAPEGKAVLDFNANSITGNRQIIEKVMESLAGEADR